MSKYDQPFDEVGAQDVDEIEARIHDESGKLIATAAIDRDLKVSEIAADAPALGLPSGTYGVYARPPDDGSTSVRLDPGQTLGNALSDSGVGLGEQPSVDLTLAPELTGN